jgi:hypothetical protein
MKMLLWSRQVPDLQELSGKQINCIQSMTHFSHMNCAYDVLMKLFIELIYHVWTSLTIFLIT